MVGNPGKSSREARKGSTKVGNPKSSREASRKTTRKAKASSAGASVEVASEEQPDESARKPSRGRPAKRGRKSHESQVKSSLVKVGALSKRLEAHNDLRGVAAEQRKLQDRAKSQAYRQRKRSSEAKEAAGKGAGSKAKAKDAPGKHFLRVAEELEPAVYGSLEMGVGRKALESFVRDAGDFGGPGKRHQTGPKCSEAELTSTVADLRKRSGDGPRTRVRRVNRDLDSVRAYEAKWQKEKKALEKEKGDSKGRLAFLEGQLVGAEKDKRRLFAQLYIAEAQLMKDRSAKLAYKAMWYRRCKKAHLGKNNAARRLRTERMAEAMLRAKSRACGRPDLARRLKHLKAAARERTLRLRETRELLELCGEAGRAQVGHRSVRIRKQQKQQALLAKGLCRRTLRKLVISGETEQEAKAKAREEAAKLEKRAEEVVAMAFGMKEEILRRFVDTYKKTVKFAHKLKSQVGQPDKKGVAQTLESLLRPKQAQVHRKTQRPFGWVPPVEAKDVESVVEGLVDLVVGAEDVVEGLVNLVVEEMSQEGGPEWEDPGAVSIVDLICEEIAEAEERLEEEKEDDDSLGVWGEGGSKVCGSHCVLPPRWAERIAEPLMALRPYRVTNVWECVRDFMQLQACKGCFVELTLPCVQEEVEGKECTDLVKVCLQVRPHSKEVDSLLRHMVYEGSHLLKRLLNLVDVMKRGDLDTLAGLIRVRVDPEAEAQGGVSTSKIGPVMREDEIMEKFGRMAKRFREAEEDHPVHPCFWCEQRYTRKRLAVEGMKGVDDKSVKGMSDAYHRPNLKASLERRLALTGQKEAEAFPMNICTYCMGDVTKGTIGRRMVENGFRTDPLPEELACLNPYEEKFVSLVLPCYEVITLRPMGGKLPSRLCMKGTRGNIVHLRVPIEETVEHVLKTADQPMPVACDPAKSLRIYADVTTKKGKRWRNLVDMEKVIRALEWLVRNNPIYAKVRLDKEALRNYDMDEVVRLVDLDNPAAVDENLEDEAPEDEEEADERERYPAFLTQETEEHRLVNEFSMAPINRPKIAVGKDVEELRKTLTPKASGKDDPKVYRDKKIESELMAWHKAPNLDLMSLPMLYPLGRDGTFTVRTKRVRPAEYQKYRLMNKDGRFRRKKMFIHFSSFHKRERAVDSGVFASTHRNSASAKLTAGQVTAKLEGKDKDVEALTKELSTAMKAQKGSAEYWKARTGDLAVMDEELGPAHLFLTFSSAETRWAALEEELREVNADLKGVEKMSVGELCEEDPVTVALFFHRRFEAFFDEVLMADDGPLGRVSHYFWRLEYQARGAPHIHMKLWVDGGPVLGEQGVTEESVVAFIDSLMTCRKPLESENAELRKLVEDVQTHRCTASCTRSKKSKAGTWHKRCRYGYPKALSAVTEVHGIEEAVLGKAKRKGGKRLYSLRRAAGEENVNPYNPTLLRLWQGNMDIQYVGEVTAYLNAYVTGYITKGENQDTKVNWEALDADKSVSSRLRSVVNQLNRDREVGTMEAADDLLGHQLYSSSDTVIWMPVGRAANRIRTYKKADEIRALRPEDKSVFERNFVEDHYPQRHVDLEALSLYEVGRGWNYEKKGPKHDIQKKNDEVRFARTHKLCHHKEGFLVKRRKPVLLRYWRTELKAEKAEEFYEILLQLHVPWRDEAALLRGKQSFAEAYDEWEPLFPAVSKHRAVKVKLQKAKELRLLLEDKAVRLAEMEGEAGEWPEGAEPEQPPAVDPNGFRAKAGYGTDESLTRSVAGLNAKQRAIHDKIMGVVNHQCVHEDTGLVCEEPEQVLLFVSGGAGTGKSRLIETLAESVEARSGHGVVISAPTGMAARNVDGRTCHGVFKLPVQKDGKARYVELSHDQDKEMARAMFKTKLIIVDEISMVSNVTLAIIHQRLMGMMGMSGARPLFAGFNLVVLGDLLQLPPVDRKLQGYCFEAIRYHQWRKVFPGSVVRPKSGGVWAGFEYAELTENMRQREDGLWADLLGDMRIGKMERADEYLRRRVWEDPEGRVGVDAEVALIRNLTEQGKSPVGLVPKVEQAIRINASMLVEMKLKAVFVHARDSRASTGSKARQLAPSRGVVDVDLSKGSEGILEYLKEFNSLDAKRTGGLPEVLPLAVGARVMLTTNVDTELGLVNGAMGVVSRLLRTVQARDHVASVVVRFDHQPETERFVARMTGTYEKSQGIVVNRNQFPLMLAYAVTIHKAQGMSLPCIVIHVGQAFESGQAYVAFSRGRTLDEVYLLSYDPVKVFCDPLCVKEYNRLRALYEKELGPLTAVQVKPKRKGDGTGKTVVRRSMAEVMATVSPSRSPETKRRRSSSVRRSAASLLREADEAGASEVPVARPSVGDKGRSEAQPWYMDIEELERRLARHYSDRGPNSGWTLWQKPSLDAWARDAALAEEDRETIAKLAAQAMKPVAAVTPEEPAEMAEAMDATANEERSGEEEAAVGRLEPTEWGFVPLMNRHPRGSGVENICFANADVQMMLASRAIREWAFTNGQEMPYEGRLVKQCLRKLFHAALTRDGSVKDVRGIRDAVSQHSVARGSKNYSDYQQHCGMEFMMAVVETCGSAMRRLLEFERRTTVKCSGCGLERERTPMREISWKLALSRGRGRVSLEDLAEEDFREKVVQRCDSCCPEPYVTGAAGEQVLNEGVEHDVVSRLEVLEGQKLMLLMVNPFTHDANGAACRSKRQLRMFDLDSVKLAGRRWRLVSGVESMGQTTAAGHYVAYARSGAQWRRKDDQVVTELKKLPVGRLYGIMLEMIE